MKYALIPVLKEVAEFMEHHNIDRFENSEDFEESLGQCDHLSELADQAFSLLFRIHKANKTYPARELEDLRLISKVADQIRAGIKTGEKPKLKL